MKKLTTAQLDKQILDHADEIVRLMKIKGFNDDSGSTNYECINIWLKHRFIQVDGGCQSISTKDRKKEIITYK